jgi:hypothetical protein
MTQKGFDKMRRQQFVLLLLFLVDWFLTSQSSLADSRELLLGQFASRGIDKIRSGDYENLFKDFYLPPDYTVLDRANDKEALMAGFKELYGKQLGSFDSILRTESLDQEIAQLSLGTGTEQTRSLPSVDLIYRTTFRDFGEGFIIIGIIERPDRLLLKHITVGLPLSNPKSAKLVRDFANFMVDIATEQQKRGLSISPKSRTGI